MTLVSGREGARASLKWKTEVFKPRQTRERAQRTEEGTAEYPFSHIVSSDHLLISFPIQQIIVTSEALFLHMGVFILASVHDVW